MQLFAVEVPSFVSGQKVQTVYVYYTTSSLFTSAASVVLLNWSAACAVNVQQHDQDMNTYTHISDKCVCVSIDL